MVRITQKLVDSLKPSEKDRFCRDDKLTGFGVKVSPKGRISFIAEGRVRGGRTRRITIGQHPALCVADARDQASELLQAMQRGEDPKEVKEAEEAKRLALDKTLDEIFSSYLTVRGLKPKTEQDYRNTLNSVFEDWKSKPIRSITSGDVESKFVEAKDTRGQATAAKAFRIISAVFNFAMAEEIAGEKLISENPADVIKKKRYDRKVKPRSRFLSEEEIGKLIHFWTTEKDWPGGLKHGVSEQGINYVMLLLCSGLRRSEGLKLRWDDIDFKKNYFTVHDTKNGTDHYVPLSGVLTHILKRQKEALVKQGKEESSWVFPARNGEGHMTEPKSQLAKICTRTGIKFRLHDLRRTFATHAQANGASFDLIKKALNHKSGDVTEGYIITQVDTLRLVFDAVADGYHTYYDPDWNSER